MPASAPVAATSPGSLSTLVGPLILAFCLILILATVFFSDRIGRRLPARSTGFLRAAGFYLAVKSLAFDPPIAGEPGGQDHTTLRVTWLARNDWTAQRSLPPAGVGLLVDGAAHAPEASEPIGDLAIPARKTADLVTCYRLPATIAARIAAGELGLAATLRLDPEAADPVAVAPLDVGWLLGRPAG